MLENYKKNDLKLDADYDDDTKINELSDEFDYILNTYPDNKYIQSIIGQIEGKDTLKHFKEDFKEDCKISISKSF